MSAKKKKRDDSGSEKSDKLKRKELRERARAPARRAGQAPAMGRATRGSRCASCSKGAMARAKGGTIKAITERVSPRVFRVVALPAPTEREKSQMYLQRYMRQFPAAAKSSFSIAAGTTAPASNA